MITWKDQPIAFVDTETTGFDSKARIVEMSVLVYEHRRFAAQISAVVNPGNDVDWEHPSVIEAMHVNGLDRNLLKMSQGFAQLWPAFMVQIRRADILCGQNLQFDDRMLGQECNRCGLETLVYAQTLDTLILDWALNPGKDSYKLERIAPRWNVPVLGKHRASDDARLCADILVAMMGQLPDDKGEMLGRFDYWEGEYRVWRDKREAEKKPAKVQT